MGLSNSLICLSFIENLLLPKEWPKNDVIIEEFRKVVIFPTQRPYFFLCKSRRLICFTTIPSSCFQSFFWSTISVLYTQTMRRISDHYALLNTLNTEYSTSSPLPSSGKASNTGQNPASQPFLFSKSSQLLAAPQKVSAVQLKVPHQRTRRCIPVFPLLETLAVIAFRLVKRKKFIIHPILWPAEKQGTASGY